MIKRLLVGVVVSVAAISLIPAAAFAHVVVTPAQAGVGERLVFHVSIPNEKQVAVTNLKLTIPEGVTSVMPTSINGWTITTTMNSISKDPEVATIVWSDGIIPVGQRQDFSFSAQVPAKAAELDWKAYQTYADGTIVHWDQKPTENGKVDGNAGPYSVTHVADDLKANSTDAANDNQAPGNTLAIVISIVAVILSIGSLLLRKRR